MKKKLVCFTSNRLTLLKNILGSQLLYAINTYERIYMVIRPSLLPQRFQSLKEISSGQHKKYHLYERLKISQRSFKTSSYLIGPNKDNKFRKDFNIAKVTCPALLLLSRIFASFCLNSLSLFIFSASSLIFCSISATSRRLASSFINLSASKA